MVEVSESPNEKDLVVCFIFSHGEFLLASKSQIRIYPMRRNLARNLLVAAEDWVEMAIHK